MMRMTHATVAIPAEPIGSIPRPLVVIPAVQANGEGVIATDEPDAQYHDATRDTLQRSEDRGSPVVSDGEQRKYHDFATYALHGLANIDDSLQRFS